MKTICSFFTGCGGLDIGLGGDFPYLGKSYAPNGFKTVFGCDISTEAQRVYSAYNKEASYHVGSIVDVIKQHTANPILPKTDIVTGGFPCTDFSLAGKRCGFSSYRDHLGNKTKCAPEESRGMLYYWMCKAIEIIKPFVIIAENVKGLESIPNARKMIVSDFEALGYTMQFGLVNTADYGVPQNRERLIFVGVRNDALTEVAKQVLDADCFPEPPKILLPTRTGVRTTCRQAFLGLPEPPVSLAARGRPGKTDEEAYSKAAFLLKGQGQTEVELDGQAPTIRAEHHGNIEYRRLSLARGGKYVEELNAGMIERRLTIKECSRLMTFPDNMQFLPHVSTSEAYKIIGNAVPPLLGWAIGKNLSNRWEFLFGAKND